MADDTTQESSQSSQDTASQSTQANASPPANSSAQQTQNSSSSQQSNQAQATTKPERPAWVADAFWDADKGIKPEFADHYRELATFKAAEDSRRLTLPQKPEDYPFELPADFKTPQGIEFKLNPNDPMLAHARNFAKAAGLTSDQFKSMVGIYASGQIESQQGLETAVAAEIEKLGVNGTARVTAVQNFFTAQLGEDIAKHMNKMLVSEPIVRGWEKIMSNYLKQGGSNFTQQHRENDAPGKVSQAEYERMTYSQKKEYAAKFGQQAA